MLVMSLTHTPNEQRDPFSRAENLIEQLVEGSFARLFGQHLHPHEVAFRLAHAVEDNAALNTEGILCAPNVYDVSLNREDCAALLAATPNLVEHLADTVIDLAHRAGLRLMLHPIVRLLPEESVPAHDVRITARHTTGGLHSTQVLSGDRGPAQPPAAPH